MLLDIVIVVLLALALFIGFRRGLLEPLLTEIFFFGTLFLFFLVREPYGTLFGHLLGGPVVPIMLAIAVALVAGFGGARLGGSLRRIRALRGIDGLVGVVLHATIALTLLYVMVSLLVVFNQAFRRIDDASHVSAPQVDQLTRALNTNPLASMVVGSTERGQIRADSALPPGLSQLLTINRDLLRPQLETSRLARVVLALGSHLPLIGKVGPGDLK